LKIVGGKKTRTWSREGGGEKRGKEGRKRERYLSFTEKFKISNTTSIDGPYKKRGGKKRGREPP